MSQLEKIKKRKIIGFGFTTDLRHTVQAMLGPSHPEKKVCGVR